MILTPTDLAERWQCSTAQIYKLVRQGQLRGFKIGSYGLRFRLEEIEAFECASNSTEEVTAPTGVKGTSLSVARSVRQTSTKPSGDSWISNEEYEKLKAMGLAP